MSVYKDMHTYLMDREFVSFLMTFFDNSNDVLMEWATKKFSSQEKVRAGENLIFLERLMGSKGNLSRLIVVYLHNMSRSIEFPKILASLPAKYGMKPILKLYIEGKEIVNQLIPSLCRDTDFQAKLSSYVPVNFTGEDIGGVSFSNLRTLITRPFTVILDLISRILFERESFTMQR